MGVKGGAVLEVGFFPFCLLDFSGEEDEFGAETFEQESVGSGDANPAEANNRNFKCFSFEHY